MEPKKDHEFVMNCLKDVPLAVEPKIQIHNPKYVRWFNSERESLIGWMTRQAPNGSGYWVGMKFTQDALYKTLFYYAYSRCTQYQNLEIDLTHAWCATTASYPYHNKQRSKIALGYQIVLWELLTALELRGLLILARSQYLENPSAIGGRSSPGNGGMVWKFSKPTWLPANLLSQA